MAATSFVDDRAFERMYRRYVSDVYGFALALVRNPSEAEDVTQTTFMNAYRALQAGEEPRRPQNWLLTIAHNTARSGARRAVRRPREVPLDDVVGQLAVPEPQRTNLHELVRALGRLPINQRAAITMRELEGRSYPEIAETLGVSVPAVEALLARARRTLRRHAAAIRGLNILVLPRSLRRLLENGDATMGGALGAGLIAKAAAVVLAAGVVAGGVGSSLGAASTTGASPAKAGFSSGSAAAVPSAPRSTTPKSGAVAPRAVVPLHDGHGETIRRIGRLPRPDESGGAARAAQVSQAPAGSAMESKPVQHASEPVRSAVDAARQVVQTGSTAVPSLPPVVAPPAVPAPPPVSLPPVPVPPVTVPPVPVAPPAVPTPPQPPALP